MADYFEAVQPIAYEGAQSRNPLAFKWYDRDRIVLGKRMEDQLRFAACYGTRSPGMVSTCSATTARSSARGTGSRTRWRPRG